jgi:hypothetical protein
MAMLACQLHQLVATVCHVDVVLFYLLFYHTQLTEKITVAAVHAQQCRQRSRDSQRLDMVVLVACNTSNQALLQNGRIDSSCSSTTSPYPDSLHEQVLGLFMRLKQACIALAILTTVLGFKHALQGLQTLPAGSFLNLILTTLRLADNSLCQFRPSRAHEVDG